MAYDIYSFSTCLQASYLRGGKGVRVGEGESLLAGYSALLYIRLVSGVTHGLERGSGTS